MLRVALNARVFVGVTTAAAVGALVALVAVFDLPSVGMLAVFGAAAILAEYFQVESEAEALDPGGARRFSFSSGVHIAAVIIAGPLVAAAAAAFGVLMVDRLGGRSWLRTVFNAAVFVLATSIGAAVFSATGGEIGTLQLPHDLVPFVALCVTYSVLNTVFIAGVISVSESTPFWRFARTSALGDLPSDLAEASLAGAIAFCALRDPWAVVLLGPLAIAAYQAHARLALLRLETAQALETFATVVDERDPSTYRHSERVAGSIRLLGEALRLPNDEIARLAWAGRLHDLGKISVDGSILRKPGALDEAELAAMRRHPRLSARLLRRFRFARDHARAVEYHHERFDGNGYYGIDNRHLPLASHVLIVADSFDAMTSDRPYRRGMLRDHALEQLERGAGTQFHPMIVKAFVATQRGEDVMAAMTPAELGELRRLSLSESGGRGRSWLREVETATIILSGVAALLVALALKSLPLAVAAATFTGVGCMRRVQMRRNGERLVQALTDVEGEPDAFEAAMQVFATDPDLVWGGLVAWREEELTGRLAAAWNKVMPGPAETALTSWLIRDVDQPTSLLLESGTALGVDGEYVALHLADGEVVRAFLVLGYRKKVPDVARRALAGLPAELATRLRSGTEPVELRAVS